MNNKRNKNQINYIDVMRYEDDRYPFQFFIGGRGTGKTYSALRYCLGCSTKDESVRSEIESECGYAVPNMEPYIWARRTDKEYKMLVANTRLGDAGNPFAELNRKYGVNYGVHGLNQNLAGIYRRRENKDGVSEPFGEPVGYCCSIMQVSGIRGMEFNHVKRVFYDEFIPERHAKRINGEGEAILNAIESIGRNRELEGERPLKVYFLSNSNNIYTPLFVELGLVNVIERALNRGQTDIYLKDRKCAIHLLQPAESFKTAKAQTALYQFASGTNFSEMALENDFVYNDFSNTGYRRIKGMRPMCWMEDVYIYQENGGQYLYATYAPAKCPGYHTDLKVDRMAWNRTYRRICREAMEKGKFYYETYDIKEKVMDVMFS